MKPLHAAVAAFLFAASGLLSSAAGIFAQEGVKIPDALTVIHSRKSVRKYLDKPVSKEQLETLLRAGMAAPTAMNRQPWEFVVVTERAVLDTLALSRGPRGKSPLSGASAAIVVCGDTSRTIGAAWIQDCSAASENILLAAEAIGLGAVWTGVYIDRPEPVDNVRRVLGLPPQIVPLNIIVIGYPTGEEKPKDKWNPGKIHWNGW